MNTKNQLQDLFLQDKPTRVILSLKDSTGKYASVLSKESDCTYTHTLKILTQMHSAGIVHFEKRGRIKFVKLTPNGENIAHSIATLVRRINQLDDKKNKKTKKPAKRKTSK